MALHLKKLLESLSLRSFVKVSGSKRLHLTVPLNTKVTYELTQPFAKALADLAARQPPLPGGVGHVKDLAPGQSADRLEPEFRLQNHGMRLCNAGEGGRAVHLDAAGLG